MALVEMPKLREIDATLNDVPRWAPLVIVGRVFVFMAGYAMFAGLAWAVNPWWWVPALASFAVGYLTFLVAVHDLAHRSIGLTERANGFWLSVVGVVGEVSGTAIQATHRVHHARFNLARAGRIDAGQTVFDDDPELALGELPFWKVLAFSPLYQFLLWRWTRRHQPARARRCVIEAVAHALLGLGSVAVFAFTGNPVFFVYMALVFVASLVFPIVNNLFFHDVEATDALDSVRSVGGVAPWLTFGLSDHLVHHLYPTVPSWNARRLAVAVDPYLN